MLTAAADGSEDPVRFAVGAGGAAFSYGRVATGGVGGAGGGAGLVQVRPIATPSADAPVTDPDEPPRLDEPEPCKGYFPTGAQADAAEATVRLVASAEGRAQRVELVSEAPTAQGFGAAAVRCLRERRFVPARKHGAAVSARVVITVRFRR